MSFRHEKAALDGDGLEFDFLSVLWEEDGEHHFIRNPDETFDLDKLRKSPIPPKDLYPSWHIGLPIAPLPIPDGTYIKHPRIVCYTGDGRLANFLLAEADILTLLEQSQHPNIGRFLGCILLDGLVNGLCLKRYPQTLADVIPYGSHGDVSPDGIPFEPSEQLNRASIVCGIVSGVKFIHSLKLVHNDLNPRNIMLDEFKNPVIVDFDSCKPVGTSMKGQKSFTAPWGRRNALNMALYDNDYLSLGLLELYLRGEYPPSSGQFSRMVDQELVDGAIAMGKHLVEGKAPSVSLTDTESD
jgi:serine/threonine protein kinase